MAGTGLIAGGLLWQPLLAVEHVDHLAQRSALWGWYADQVGFLLAMLLVLLGLTALDRAGVAGGRPVGCWALHGLVLGWLLLVIAGAAQVWLSWPAADTVTGVGGLLTYPTVLLAGAATARAGRLTSWRRWALLGEGVYQTTLILVPLLFGGAGPGWVVEAGWQLCWVVVGVAALQVVDGHSHAPGRTDLDSYYIYGAALLAPVDGMVTSVRDGLPDQPIGSVDTVHQAGNYVVIDVGGGRHVMVGHLRPGTVRVAVGDAVEAGQVIAHVGNSGNTDQPHIHIQAQNLPAFDDTTEDPVALLRALRTYPLVFEDVVLTRGGAESTPATADPRRGDLVRPAS